MVAQVDVDVVVHSASIVGLGWEAKLEVGCVKSRSTSVDDNKFVVLFGSASVDHNGFNAGALG